MRQSTLSTLAVADLLRHARRWLQVLPRVRELQLQRLHYGEVLCQRTRVRARWCSSLTFPSSHTNFARMTDRDISNRDLQTQVGHRSIVHIVQVDDLRRQPPRHCVPIAHRKISFYCLFVNKEQTILNWKWDAPKCRNKIWLSSK